jgi:NDP-sugar pyrophosphorylase family protein
MNGDILTDLHYNDFFETHVKKDALFSISSHLREEKIDYGVLQTENNILTGFKEKPKNNYEVSMGIYMLSKKVLDYIPDNSPYGFDQLMLDLLSKQKSVFVNTYTGLWLDIGRPDDYIEAIECFDQLKDKILYV